MAINWGMGGPQDNALAYFQFGANMAGRMADAKAEREKAKAEAEGRNAMTRYMTTGEGFEGAAAYNPEAAMKARTYRDEQAVNEQTRARTQLHETAKLFDGVNPENYVQRVAMAGQLGLDVSNVPPQYDPQWVQQQGVLMKFMSSDEGIEALSTAGKIAVDMGYKPGTPEFNAKATEIWQADAAKYIPVQPGGSVAEVLPGQAPRYAIGGGQAAGIQEGATATNPQTGEKVIYRGGQWVPMGGGVSNGTGGFQAAFGNGI